MKKLIQLFSTTFTIVPLVCNVVSCKKDDKWESFQKFINDTDNDYLIMINGVDSTDSKNMHSELWNPIINNREAPLSNLYQNTDPNISWNYYINNKDPKINPENKTPFQLGSSDVKFENLEGQVQNKLWDEDWSKNIMNWCGQKSWEYTTGNNPNIKNNKSYIDTYTSKYKSTTSPEFIYIEKGNFMGIHQFSDLKFSKTNANNSALTFYEWSYDIFINNKYYGN